MATRCLVFGGSGTIGSEVCRKLLAEGAKVAFTWRSREKDIPGALALRCDFSDLASISGVVKEAEKAFGGLDAVVIATGASAKNLVQDFDRITPETFDAIFSVNTRGVFFAAQASFEALKARGGNITVLGSLDGLKPIPSPVHFAASKAALKGMVEALSKEAGEFKIKVNLLAPGIVESESALELPERHRKNYLKYCSTQRFAKPAEVAEWAAFLSCSNTYLTGQSIVLDGGL